MKKFLLIAIVFLACIMLSGCYDGLVSEEEYSGLIEGIVATKDGAESVTYKLDILKDEIEFNGEIQSATYSRIEILPIKECKVKGLSFCIRCSQNATLGLSIFTNDKFLDSAIYDCKSFEVQDVYFFFDESVVLNDENSLYILVDEQTESGRVQKTKFVFDTLLIFFEEG